MRGLRAPAIAIAFVVLASPLAVSSQTTAPAGSEPFPDSVFGEVVTETTVTRITKPLAASPTPGNAAEPLAFPKAPDALHLHVEVRGNCAHVYAKHEHQAWITRGPDPAGPRAGVDVIHLHSMIGSDAQTKPCPGTDTCQRTEKEYNAGCRRSCASASATHRGMTARTSSSCMWEN